MTPYNEVTEPNTATFPDAAHAAPDDQDAEPDFTLDSDLPYPLPLSRNAFLAPDFDALTYLSTLHNRHQTLEDLRADLRARAHDLSRELTDLVNDEYETFLGVGDTLVGGDEKVQGARLGVLGLRREIEGVREVVQGREREVSGLLQERRGVRKEIVLGRRLLEVEARVAELETRVAGEVEDDEHDSEEDGDEADGLGHGSLSANVVRYLQIELRMKQTPHPFLDTLKPRLTDLKKNLVLDLDSVLRAARRKKADADDGSAVLKLLTLYESLGESRRAVKVLGGG